MGMGMRAMIARSIGARDPASANHVAIQSFVVSAVFAAVMAVVGLFLSEAIMRLFPLEEGVILEGATYLRIVFVGAIAMILRMMCETAMQAAGDAQTPMRIAVLFRAFHVALCPFMVLGWWVFPQLGVTGAALTNIISQSLGLGLSLWYLTSGRTSLRLTLRGFRVDASTIWRIVRIGVPASIMGMQQALGGFVFVRIMSVFGTYAVAAHTVSQRVEMVLFMPVVGLGTAAGVLAGQNLGARHPERAERGGWIAAGLAVGFMAVCCGGLLLGAEGVVSIFNQESGLVDMGSVFIRIATAGYILIGLMIVLQFCISGAGDTVPAMLFSVLIVWGVQIPLAYLLPEVTDLGVYGVRWAIVVAIAVGAVAYILYFRTGRWKRKRL